MSRMHVEMWSEVPGIVHGNILWSGKWPMRSGVFRSPHPCAANPKPVTFGPEPATDDPLGRFRGRGYYASCFPEGDGIAFRTMKSQSTAQVAKDFEDCFGFAVEVKRS